MATTSLGAEPQHLWADGAQCSIGAGSRASFAAGAIAWRITGRVVAFPSATATGERQQADVYTVEIDAQRVTGATSPATTSAPRTITLRPEERVLIDRADVSGACGSGEMRLEATVGPSSGGFVGAGGRGGVGRGGGGGRGAGVGGGTAGVGRSGGGGAAAMAGQGAGTSSGMGRGSATGGRGGGGARGSGVPAAMGVPPGTVITLRAPEPPIDAELWLVHHLPTGPERVLPLTVRIGSTFTFPAVIVTTSQGPVNVEVSGAIYERLLNGAADGLSVEIKRRLRGDGPPSIDYLGSSTRQLAMPPASEVVSFPIPNYLTEAGTGGRGASTPRPGARGSNPTPAQTAALEQAAMALPSSRLLEGNSFELRLRIKAK